MPQPVNIQEATAAQKESNIDAIKTSAAINAVDIYSPYGSITYDRNPDGTPKAQITSLNPDSQYIYDRQMQIGKTLADTANSRLENVVTTPYTNAGLPYDPTKTDLSGLNTDQAYSGNISLTGLNFDQSGLKSLGVSPLSLGTMNASLTNPANMPGFSWSNMGRDGAGGISGQSSASPYSALSGQVSTGTQPQGGPTVTTDSTVMPYDPRSYGNMQYFTNDVGNAMYDQSMSRINPLIEQQNRQFDQMMADRGIPIGSDAYNRAKESMSRSQNDLVSSAASAATQASLAATQGIVGLEQGLRSSAWNENLQGSQQQTANWQAQFQAELARHQAANQDQKDLFQADLSRYQADFGREQALLQNELARYGAENQTELSRYGAEAQTALSNYQTQNQAILARLQAEQGLRATANTELLTERNQAINEVSAILQGSPALGMPSAPTVPTYQMNPVDVMGAYNNNYEQQMRAYNTAQQQQNSIWQGVFGVASAAAPYAMKLSNPGFKEVLRAA